MPECSIVIPTRQRLAYFKQALASVLAQRDVDLEVIVVEDGSTDGTQEFLANVQDPRVRVFSYDQALGETSAVNAGLRQVRGDWVGVLHDDDIWAPTKLHTQLDSAAATGRHWVYAGCVYVDAAGHVIGGAPPPTPDQVAADLPRRNVIPAGWSNVIWRAGVLADDGLLDERLRFAMDWDMNLRLLRHGLPGVVTKPLIAYRQHGRNQSSRFLGDPTSYLADIRSEHPYLEAKHADVSGGRRVDVSWFHHNVASEALRVGQRGHALTHYTRAIVGGDWGSLLRMGGVFVPQKMLGGLRRRFLGSAGWMQQAEIWLGELRANPGDDEAGEVIATNALQIARDKARRWLRSVARLMVVRLPVSWLMNVRTVYLDPTRSAFLRRCARMLLYPVHLRGVPSEADFVIPQSGAVTPDGSGIRMVAADSAIANWMYWAGLDVYEPNGPALWASLVRSHDSVLELGANIGIYTLAGGLASPTTPYVALEPNPASADVLRRNLALNQISHVEVLEAAAVGDRATSSVNLYMPSADPYATDHGSCVEGAVELGWARVPTTVVKAVPMSELVTDVDLIKMDIEGLELEVLSPVRSWIVSEHPTLMVEVVDGLNELGNFLCGLMTDVGYRAYALGGGGDLSEVTIDALRRVDLEARLNARDVILITPVRAQALEEMRAAAV